MVGDVEGEDAARREVFFVELDGLGGEQVEGNGVAGEGVDGEYVEVLRGLACEGGARVAVDEGDLRR